MAVIGWVATGVALVVVVAAVGLAVTALPDVNRYRRLRNM